MVGKLRLHARDVAIIFTPYPVLDFLALEQRAVSPFVAIHAKVRHIVFPFAIRPT